MSMEGVYKLRSFIFFFLTGLLTLGFMVVSLFLFSKKINAKLAKFWAKILLMLLKDICKINLKITGKKNIPKTPFIVVCKHQSAMETLVFPLLLPKPIFIIKKAILFIPFLGLCLKRAGAILIDRSKGRGAIRYIQTQLSSLSNENSLVIFPEGTRTKAGIRIEKYNAGIAMIYETLRWPVLPVALNTGMFWSKHGPMRSGTATMKFLPGILPSKEYNRKQFLKQLNEIIENESIKLYKTTLAAELLQN